MLIGEKIYLRFLERDDTSDIVRWRNSQHVLKNFIIQDLLTKDMHNWWFDNKVNKKEVVQFIIMDKISNRGIGSVFIKDLDIKNKKGEYGIFIGENSFLGKGIGTEAAKLICNYAFMKLKLHKVYLRVYSDNLKAIKSYKKAGFEIEGELRDEIFNVDGYRNITLMSKLKG